MSIPKEISKWMEQSQIIPVECCGHGGYGEIWLVRAPFGQNWALKIIDKTKLDKTAWEREVHAIQKYRAAIGLEQNLLYIQQSGELDDYFFYLMETADNRNSNANGPYEPDTLEYRLQERRLTFIETKDCIHGLLNGLQILHKHGLIHRDIKPANIFFVNGKPKFGDLGLVTEYNPTLSFAGTEGFCPPSLLDGKQVDGKLWDLYSLGMVVYCCATGYPSAGFPEVPDDLMNNPRMEKINHFLARACSPDPRECYKNVEEFRTAFNACFPEAQQRGKQFIAPLLAGVAIGFAVSASWFLISRLIYTSNQSYPPVIQTPISTPLVISTIQPFKRNSSKLFEDSFAQGYKEDWDIKVSDNQSLRKIGIDGLFWNLDDTAKPDSSLTLALPSLSLPVNFEIAWECFGDFDKCSLFVALSSVESQDSSSHSGFLFEFLENHGNVNLISVTRNGKKVEQPPIPATMGNIEDNNVFITTNRIVKDGKKLTFYLDEQAMYSLKLTEQDMEFLKDSRFSMNYRTENAGTAIIKNFTVFIVPGLE